jgi:hypothetical protein
MWSEGTVKAELHHQGLGVGELSLCTAIKWLRNKQVFAEYPLDDLKVLVGVICLAERLLPSHLAGSKQPIGTTSPTHSECSSVWIHLCSVVQSLFFLLGTFFEKHLSQHIFLLLV